MKELLTTIAVVLTFVGYAPYIRDTLARRTKPHVYTWFIWALVTTIAFGLQASAEGGVGSLVTLAAALACFVVFLFGLKRGDKEITRLDTGFFIAALIAIGVWLVARQPIVSTILVSLIDMLGFAPTIRKSWHRPHEETLISYVLNTVRFVLALFALEQYSIVTVLYPATWLAANGLFSLFLIARRQQLDRSNGQAS